MGVASGVVYEDVSGVTYGGEHIVVGKILTGSYYGEHTVGNEFKTFVISKVGKECVLEILLDTVIVLVSESATVPRPQLSIRAALRLTTADRPLHCGAHP